MELLQQCRLWCDQEEYQKAVDALEAVPAEQRTPEMDSELARGYIALAGEGEQEPYKKALRLLAPHEEHFAGDHCWYSRMASAWYHLGQYGPALRCFTRALEARPGDQDTQACIDDCRSRLALPRFEKNFRERTAEAWAAFAAGEAELRALMDADADRTRGDEIVARCGAALELALPGTAFDLGIEGEQYELFLSAEGIHSRLLPLVYFRSHAPESVLEHWRIQVGRPADPDFTLRDGELEVRAADVQIWAERQADGRLSLAACCEKLLPLQQTDAEQVWRLLSFFIDQVLGEINAIAHVGALDLLAAPKKEPAVSLAELPQTLKALGLPLYQDAADYLETSALAYELEPIQDPDADWRFDVGTGSTLVPALINDYLHAESDTMDDYHRAGIAAGFLFYPLDGFNGVEKEGQALRFRDALQQAVTRAAGEDAVAFIGGATGLYCGYLDFIAWDLDPVLQAAAAFFDSSSAAWGSFHTFRRDVGGVALVEQEEPPALDPETGSLLSAADIAAMEGMSDGVSGYYYKMLAYINDFVDKGVEEGRFTRRQARQDLQIALWYAFACNNIGTYESYYRAAQWMPASEPSAKGCGTWYYRYACALTYCGRLEDARRSIEQGLREESGYPWGWLQAAKLRAHFGDKAGALEAVERGLQLVPGDYEFLTLRQEIHEGASIERMEYHWIDPGEDGKLQAGQARPDETDEKQQSISCIAVDPAGLARFQAIFQPSPAAYEKDAPYCSFPYPIQGQPVSLVFRMNEAGLSKLDAAWLERLRGWLDSGGWLRFDAGETGAGALEAVLVGLDRRIGLLYCKPDGKGWFQIFLRPDGTRIEDALWTSDEES